MKTLLKFFVISTLLVFFFVPPLVRAQDDDQGVSFQAFYDQLGDQGTWVQTDDYGYVFQPNNSDPDWAPYTVGHWVDSDDGWLWVSDEPWGWATYHYGRWVNIDGTGWVWIPGYRWAPAWVSWRYGGGYCGWAPLPPETFVGAEFGEPGVSIGAGFHFGGDVDVSFDIGAGCYNFIRIEDMGDPDYRHHFVSRENNFTIINHTTNVTNININGQAGGGAAGFHGVSVGGPPINDVNAHARTHIAHVTLTASNQPGPAALHGNSLAVYAPKVNPATLNQAKPAKVGQTINHPTFNRGNSITKPLDVTASVKPPAPNPQAIQAAQQAQTHAPASAKIATEKTPVKTTLTKPLTSLQPVSPTPATTPNTGAPGANQPKPGKENNAGNAPFTGAPGNPAATSQNEPKPSPTYNPSGVNPANPNEGQGQPPKPKHQQNQGQGNGANTPYTGQPATPTEKPQNEAPPTHHTQTQNTGGSYQGGGNQPLSQPPASTYHPQNQGGGYQGGGNQPSGQPPASTYHSQNQGGGSGGGGATHHNQQGQPSQGGSQSGGNNGSTNNASGQHGR